VVGDRVVEVFQLADSLVRRLMDVDKFVDIPELKNRS